MKRHVSILCLILGALMTAAAAGAGDFDGSRPLLISVSRVIECTPDGDCREVSLASTDLPQFLKVDFRIFRQTAVSKNAINIILKTFTNQLR